MTGPQGYDPTQAWQPPAPDRGEGQQDSGHNPDQQWQPPAYTQTPYSPYQQQQPTGSYPAAPQYPAVPGYPPPEQYGQQPAQYGQPTQYGQYPQPTGQYGQPSQYGQYPQQPGQYGQYPQQPGQYGQPAPDGKRASGVIGLVTAAFLGIVVLVVLVLGFWKPGFFVTTKLDISKAQEGVQQILADQTNGYGAKNVKDVKCNDGQNPVVKQGETFNCEVSIDGTKRQVTVTFRDNTGTYEVGRPK